MRKNSSLTIYKHGVKFVATELILARAKGKPGTSAGLQMLPAQYSQKKKTTTTTHKLT